MDKSETEVKVEFTIFSESNLNHLKITELIGFEPTVIWNKGDLIRKDLFRKESVWIYSIGYIKTLDVENILDMIIEKIDTNLVAISQYIRENNLKTKFFLVLRIVNNQAPSVYLSKRLIHLCDQLDAEIDADILI